MTKKCQKAFAAGEAKRAPHPLGPGTYKLLEAYRDWQRQYETLKLLESALDNRNRRCPLTTSSVAGLVLIGAVSWSACPKA